MFAIVYLTPGVAFPYDGLDADDRAWLVKRLERQKRDEAAAFKRGRAGKR
jgi:hypothetical protein